MDQAVKANTFPGAYPLSHSETEAGSLFKNRANDRKYLPDTAEYNFEKKDLSSRCVSLASSGKDNETSYIQLAKNIVFNLDPIYFDSIDEESWKNMADSLKFSGIDSLEKATAMDLKVCPPCPVFHTWVALHGTTIFNGLNNPDKLRGINYIQRILEEGSKLAESDIPLLIVFSGMSLRQSQIDQMRAEFKNHDNILCISLEKDLQLKFPVQLEKYAKRMSLYFNDSIRIVVSQNITKTINFCINRAKAENKTKLAHRLEKLGANHLFYSDIDNQWLSKPPYILASHGMFTQPRLSMSLTLSNHINSYHVEQLSTFDKKLLQKHRSFFSDIPFLNSRESIKWSSDKAKKLFDYILSGEAQCNYEHLSKLLAAINSDYDYLLNARCGVNWDGENSCLFLAEQSKDTFLRCALKSPCLIDLHQEPGSEPADDSYNPDPYYREAHSLVGMQLLKYHYYRNDFTW
ncbi:hypothetical protein [Endozoicomonas sp. 8E]|uniref:hypothetical protein n=1 Tax=Endozoicomonas sp. 8E TaxID=3035692 RepID=UPI002938DCB5|nr:hypothetical protein [Endozoicomonas sp. 8E]WOG29770.1 hypothetical protein P6910_08970 [Endozoicomonas sp. 8E]